MNFETFLTFIGDEFNFQTSGIQESTTFEEINFDEFDVIELVMSVEEKCHVEIPDEALQSFKTIGDFANFVKEKTE